MRRDHLPKSDSQTMRAGSFLLLLGTMVFMQLAQTSAVQDGTSNGYPMTIRTTIPAPSLGDAIFPNPAELPYVVSLPPGYNTSNVRYPVIYFLHGFGGSAYSFQYLSSIMSLNGTIVVLPSGNHNVLVGSFYTNSPVTGNWEDFIVSDVVDYTDAHYRTIQDPDFRGIAGFSMGGYGALNIAMKNPDIFGSVYAIGPGLFDESGLSRTTMLTPGMAEYFLQVEGGLASLNETAAHTEYLSVLRGIRYDESRILMFAYGSAFAPNPEKGAPYIDYPYSYNSTGDMVLNENAWKKWEGGFGDIENRVQRYRDNLLSLKGIGVEYGVHDAYPWIPEGCRYFSQRLTAQNIDHRLTETNYGHGDSMTYRVQKYMMPFFLDIFRASPTPTPTPALPDSAVALAVAVTALTGLHRLARKRRDSSLGPRPPSSMSPLTTSNTYLHNGSIIHGYGG